MLVHMKKLDTNKMTKFEDFLKKELRDPKFKKAFEDGEVEHQIVCAMIDKRIKEGLTQKQLATKLGTTQSALARFEGGHVSPRLAFIQKLARALNMRVYVRSVK